VRIWLQIPPIDGSEAFGDTCGISTRKPAPLSIVVAGLLLGLFPSFLIAQESVEKTPRAASFESLMKTSMEARAEGDDLAAAEALAGAAKLQPGNADLHNAAGSHYFFAGKPKASVEQFDIAVELVPAREPHHWQRGISHYYAGMFEAGKRQFEIHREVNGNDVENSAFHFICVAKAESPETAAAQLIPVTGDSRVPMAEIMKMFAGELTPDEVVKAAGADKNHLCYAHLYAGLYLEALGKNEESLAHIQKAAIDYRQDHYMGKVAQVHYQLRTAE